MNIAILGYNSLGKNVYNVLENKKNNIFRDYDINIKYILIDENFHSFNPVFTTDYNIILEDNDINLIIETYESNESFNLIKRALNSSKHVITSSYDAISLHYVELEALAIDMHVKLLFNSTVGGSSLIINSLLKYSSFNDINKIEAILDENINDILTRMTNDNISLNDGIEPNKYYDFSCEQQAKKLSILTMIAFNSTVNIDEIYKCNIKDLKEDIILIANLLGCKVKLLASAYLSNYMINAMIEPVLVKNTDILSNVSNNEILIKYYGKEIKEQSIISNNSVESKTNAIIFDLELALNDYRQKFMPKNSHICNGNRHYEARYLIKTKIMNDYFKEITEKNLDKLILTKPILGEELNIHKNEIEFYARIID
jgi:homoserine dehydrogenase